MKTRRLVASSMAALTVAAGLGLVPAISVEAASVPAPVRLAGADRYQTAAAISRSYAAVGGTVYVASGATAADALAVGPAVAKANGSLLLTGAAVLPSATRTELQRLRPTKIVILGGTGAVGSGVSNALKAYSSSVSRIAGTNRYDTAAKVSQLWTGASTVFLAEGLGFADALSGGAPAARDKAPMLLTNGGSLPPETAAALRRLNPSKIYLLGGTGVISANVASQAASAGTASVIRLSGADRYATSAIVAKSFYSTASSVFYATGKGFADALAGVPAAGRKAAPLLLTTSGCMPSLVAGQTARLNPATRYLLGGTGVLSANSAVSNCTPPPPVRSTYLSNMEPVDQTSLETGSYEILGKTYANSLSFDRYHTYSSVEYNLSGKQDQLSALAGIDDNSRDSEARYSYRIFGDGRMITQGEVGYGASNRIAISVSGIQRLNVMVANLAGPDSTFVLAQAAVQTNITPKPAAPNPKGAQLFYLTNLDPISSDLSNDVQRIGGKYFPYSLSYYNYYLDSSTSYEMNLGKIYKTLQATIGQEETSPFTGATFHYEVSTDNRVIASGDVAFNQTVKLNVSVVSALRLKIDITGTRPSGSGYDAAYFVIGDALLTK
ncbi:cell wall-binding repeat-containing protein [Paenarthrobacter sp. Z7-10]|uniref:cell wall-binding repeat-containing protein n=1 Tax=Paenarthrobacter sp. Z7-10 TaxID=2787635 RepID=UPI0022A96AA1|nr:cell wall-binding repeat-containing protein [Paenarthrobacter sp. Z7-10]MCZ2403453.1 cell wall-binding repeat-containing protein [Paenarthrobacter sp. Z7-10]